MAQHDRHDPRLLASIVAQHSFSFGVLRGLVERETEATLARLDGRCAVEDIHGEFMATNVRQFVWVGFQEHASDSRGATLFAPNRRGRKYESLVLTDRKLMTMRLRKHPRLSYSKTLEPVAPEQFCLDAPSFGGPVLAPLYVLFDVDLTLSVCAGIWLAAVSNFDDDANRFIHAKVPLPAAPAVLLPTSIQPMRVEDPNDMTFDDHLAAEEDSGDDPA